MQRSKKAISRMLIAIIIIVIVIIAIVAAYYVYYMPGSSPTPGLTVTLNSPANGATQSINVTTFTYTPVCTGDNIFNASLFVNGQSVESNTTDVQNNAVNSFSYTFTASGTYVWNVQVFNSTTGVFAPSNYTVIMPPPGLTVSLATPTDGTNQSGGALPSVTTFTYTPVSVGDSIVNASLWLNVSGTWQSVELNATVVQNNQNNSFSYTFTEAGTYVWNVQVFNSTTGVFAPSNYTLTVSPTGGGAGLSSAPALSSAPQMCEAWTSTGDTWNMVTSEPKLFLKPSRTQKTHW